MYLQLCIAYRGQCWQQEGRVMQGPVASVGSIGFAPSACSDCIPDRVGLSAPHHSPSCKPRQWFFHDDTKSQ